jgi:putative ABC transport system permease protein
MLKMIGVSFVLALQNIRANFFHTVLSVLGIVIGVAALVAMLSFIDGIEVYAKKQISSTTSLQSIMVRTNTHKWIDGVQVENKEPGYITLEKLQALEASLSHPAESYIFLDRPQEFFLADSGKHVGVMVTGVNAAMAPQLSLKAGRLFREDEVAQQREVTVLNEKLAHLITRQDDPTVALGRSVSLEGRSLRVIGVVASDDTDKARAAIPISLLDEAVFKEAPPTVMFEAADVEHVTALKQEIEGWLKANLAKGEGNFVVDTHQFRLQQLEQGFLIFKIVMGLITGIAVLVGGIGIMNVLLISVNERTVEIGVRKATGAKKTGYFTSIPVRISDSV